MKEEQLEFTDIMETSKNWFAMPKENGLRNEFTYNEQKIINNRNSSISHMLSLYDRQVYLLKQLQRQRG
jgi:hypothetical protein